MDAKQLLEKAKGYAKENECHIDWAIMKVVEGLADSELIATAETMGESQQMLANSYKVQADKMVRGVGIDIASIETMLHNSVGGQVRAELIREKRGF